ncbi:hypothetical protein AVEN_146543-1 [Araneus ventricosus]|uniref:Uncharacterized protein n=1 Tax=Araneus ventricosus TaxID=182803 RepID=A0A4Y2TFD3_ARAVE|nr:hypothetical protein AVEN_146543-1 [Araneus ventricosus]
MKLISRNHPVENRRPASGGSSSKPVAPLHVSPYFQDHHRRWNLSAKLYFRYQTTSITWKHPITTVTKKFHVSHSAGKVALTVFWDAMGVIWIGSSLQGQAMCHDIATPSPD